MMRVAAAGRPPMLRRKGIWMEKGVPIRAVSRSIAVLKAVNQHGTLSMMEVARMTNVAYPTACRIIQTLIHEGLVEKEPSRKYYRPTAMVQTLAQGFSRNGQLVGVARPHLLGVTDQLGWPVAVTTRVGAAMVLRDSTHDATSLTFERYYPGYELPLLESASGHLTLALMPRSELEKLLPGLTRQNSAIDSVEAVERLLDLEKVRRDGFKWIGRGWCNLTPGKTSSIAVPIMVDGQNVAALTLTYFHNAVRYEEVVERYLPTLRLTSLAISRDMAKEGEGKPILS